MSGPIGRETSTGSAISQASRTSKIRVTGTPSKSFSTMMTVADNTPRHQKLAGQTPSFTNNIYPTTGTETSIRSVKHSKKTVSHTPRGVNIQDDEAVAAFDSRVHHFNMTTSDNEGDGDDDGEEEDNDHPIHSRFVQRVAESKYATPPNRATSSNNALALAQAMNEKRVEFDQSTETQLFYPGETIYSHTKSRINQTGVHMDSDNEGGNAPTTSHSIFNKTPQGRSTARELRNAVANLSLHAALATTGSATAGKAGAATSKTARAAKEKPEKEKPSAVLKQRAVRRLGDEFNSGPGGDDDLGEQIRIVVPGQEETGSSARKVHNGPVPTVQDIISRPYQQEPPDFSKSLLVDDENPRVRGPEVTRTITEDPHTAILKFESLYQNWCARTSPANPNAEAVNDRNDVRHHLERLFGLDGTDYSVTNVQQCYDICKLQYTEVREILEFHHLEKNTTPRGEPNTYTREMVRIEEMMYDGFHALMFMLQFEFTRDGKQNTFDSQPMSVFRFKPINNSKLQDEHLLVLHVVRQARLRDLQIAIDGDIFYRQRRTAVGGYPTSSWRKYATVYEFMGEICDKESHFDMWARWVSHPRAAYGYLRDFPDAQLKKYKPDWGVIAYEDALYHQESDTFWLHSDPNKPKHLVAQWYIPLKADMRVVTDDPFVIETPILKILEDQGYNKQEKFIFAALIGRLFFPIHRMDKLELAVFMWGESQTGKSTFINFIRAFYNPDNVGKISNKQEEIFGLESIYDKMFAECSDVTRAFRMDTGDLLAICSGEYTAVKRKNKIQLSAKWATPVVFAGNEFPASWVDKKKNLLRRIFIADFPNQIVPDLNFATEIGKTLPSSHRFFIVCYLKLLQEIKQSGMDIWAIVQKSCPRFIKNREDLLMQNSPLLAFLFDCKDVEIGKDYYTPQDELMQQFSAWLTLRSLKPEGEMRPQRLKETLASQGCTVQRTEKIWPDDGVNSLLKENDYVIGLRFKSIGGGGRTVEHSESSRAPGTATAAVSSFAAEEEDAYRYNAMATEDDLNIPNGIAV